MKKRKKINPTVSPVNRNIEPEILGGDTVKESSGGNPDALTTFQTDLAKEVSFRLQDIAFAKIQDQDPDPDQLAVPTEKPIIKKIHCPPWA
jgi:hypothetical protein